MNSKEHRRSHIPRPRNTIIIPTRELKVKPRKSIEQNPVFIAPSPKKRKRKPKRSFHKRIENQAPQDTPSILPDLTRDDVVAIVEPDTLHPHLDYKSRMARQRLRRRIITPVILLLLLIGGIYAAPKYIRFPKKAVVAPAAATQGPTFNQINKSFTLSAYLSFTPPRGWIDDPAYANSTLTNIATYAKDTSKDPKLRSNLQVRGDPHPDTKTVFNSDLNAAKNNPTATKPTTSTIDGADAFTFEDSDPTGQKDTTSDHYRKLVFYKGFILYTVTLQMPTATPKTTFDTIFSDFSNSIQFKK